MSAYDDIAECYDYWVGTHSMREVVDLIHCDATQLVATLAGPYDCVFFDADRKSASSQLALLVPQLTAEVFLLADNAL
jgi:predicted O-methyltransferase YrrM